MIVLYKFILIFYVLKLCLSEPDIWHSYQIHQTHQVREELKVTNVSLAENFHLKFNVTKWKSSCSGKICHLVGLMEKSVAIVATKTVGNTFHQKSQIIQLDSKPMDAIFHQNWNSTLKQIETFAIIATDRIEWHQIFEESAEKVWVWPLGKPITHLNLFQIDYKPHLFLVEHYSGQTNAVLYEFTLTKTKNFWLKQTIPLVDPPSSSALSTYGPDSFLSIPQTSLSALLVYQLRDNHFTSYANITSKHISEVVSFEIGHKTFLAFNGFNAGIYKFTGNGLSEEVVGNTNLDGVHYWLPITLNNYYQETILVAQRLIEHEPHDAFVIEIITYNGVEFEEHEDVNCLYFGEVLTGLTCLPNGVEGAERGIVGSAAIALDNALGILVPRNGTSELFVFETVVVRVENPVRGEVEKLTAKQRFLDELIIEQKNELELLKQSIPDDTDGGALNLIEMKQLIREIGENITVFENELQLAENSPRSYAKIIFEGDVQVLEDATFGDFVTETIEDQPANQLLQDIVMRDNISNLGNKILSNLETEEIIFESVNGINASDLIFTSDKSLFFPNSLVLEKALTVLENATISSVNNNSLMQEIVDFSGPVSDELRFENVEISDDLSTEKMNNLPMKKRSIGVFPTFSENRSMDTLYIPHNLNVVNVNGHDFNVFLRQICMKNIETYIPGHTTIEGSVEILNGGGIEFLNGVKYPQDYAFSENAFPNVTGQKQFRSLVTTEVHTEAKVDNVDPNEVITLTSDQNPTGTITFNNIRIEKHFTLDGNVIENHPPNYLPNPTLIQSDTLISRINFKTLEVEGSIILLESLNDTNFEAALSDIVYKDEESVVIDAIKTFPEGLSVHSNLEIESNAINDINLDSIVTKDTDQTLNLSLINGVATFANIDTTGLFNTINVTQLEDESVKLTGTQYISGRIVFQEGLETSSLQLEAEPVGLKQGKTAFLNIDDQKVSESIVLDSVIAENVVVEGDLVGEIGGFDLREFNRNRMSYEEEQAIRSPYRINTATLSNAQVGNVNGIEAIQFTGGHLRETIKQKFLKGELKVENLSVDGSVETGKINEQTAIGDIFWNGGTHNISELIFRDIVYFDNIEIENFSGVNFADFFDVIVFKNETVVNLAGKTFNTGFTVEKLIETEKLNSIPIGDILTKFGGQNILGPLIIHGNVTFQENANISETINEIPVDNLLNFMQQHPNYYQINTDVVFKRLPFIQNLQIDGFVNEKQVADFLESIVYTSGDHNLTETVIFSDGVEVSGDIKVSNATNGLDLNEFVANVAMISRNESVWSTVKFTAPVTVEHRMSIDGPLKAESINQMRPETWSKEAIYVNKGFLPGNYIIDDAEVIGNLRTDFMNDIDMETLIPLRTKQELDGLFFDEVTTFGDIVVGNATNFRHLGEEYANTVMLNVEQEIESELEFVGNVFISGNILLLGALNQNDLSKIVTTNTDQTLNAIYDFKSKITANNLAIDGLTNAINLTEWQRDKFKLSGKLPDEIFADWTVENDLIFASDVAGEGLINGESLQRLKQEVDAHRHHKYAIEKTAIDNYKNICKDLTFMYQRLAKQIYKFKHLETYQILDFKKPIHYTHHFNFADKHFLLVNEDKECSSHLFQLAHSDHFKYLKPIATGQIAQMIPLRTPHLTYFVITTEVGGCDPQGTSLWQVVDEDLIRVLAIEVQDQLQESLIPGIFYGYSGTKVTEFWLLVKNDVVLHKHRQWDIGTTAAGFVPHGLATGLALATGAQLFRLSREEPPEGLVELRYAYDAEIVVAGNFTVEANAFLAGRGSQAVLRVGTRSSRRALLAVARHEESSVRGLDFVKVYEDAVSGRVFHKVATYKPSALVALEVGNGETLLAFMEDESVLQVYEYKGIEGFKHRMAAKVRATGLFEMAVEARKFIGMVDGARLTLIEAVMLGHQVEDGLQCLLDIN